MHNVALFYFCAAVVTCYLTVRVPDIGMNVDKNRSECNKVTCSEKTIIL